MYSWDAHGAIIRSTMAGAATIANPPSASSIGPELVIGLVAAVGTDHDQLTSFLEETLRGFNYKAKIVRVASLLHAFPKYKDLPRAPVDDYIDRHQWAGDDFRQKTKHGDALAVLGIGEIRSARLKEN